VLGAVPSEAFAGTGVVGQVAVWIAVIAGGVIAVRADERLMGLVAYAALHLVAYVILAPDTAYTWHLYPLVCVALALALLAAATVVQNAEGAALRVAGAAALVCTCAVGTIVFARSYPTDMWFGGRDGVYHKVAAFLHDHADPQDIVDAEEVGTLAYLTDLRMNDHARLVTPYPGNVFWMLTHRQPTHLRWLVLNGAQLQLGRERPYYEGRAMAQLTNAGWALFVVDVRAPRVDGRTSEWEQQAPSPP
jgi:hypothetical protein